MKTVKKNLVIFLGGCLFAVVVIYVAREARNYLWKRMAAAGGYKGNPEYYRCEKLFAAYPESEKNVVMLGDSLTALCDWNEMLSRCDIANRGICSDTSEGVFHRLDDVIRLKSDDCFLMIGINDLKSGISPEIVYENIVKIVNLLNEKGIRVVLQTCLPVSGRWKNHEALNLGVNELNTLLEAFCDENGMPLLNLTPFFMQNNTLNESLTYDGIHLKGAGYQIWAEQLNSYLRMATKSTKNHKKREPLINADVH